MILAVTPTSVTLIDNIFTNNIADINHSVHGLFITDLSDHFPVFHIAKQMEMKEMMHMHIKDCIFPEQIQFLSCLEQHKKSKSKSKSKGLLVNHKERVLPITTQNKYKQKDNETERKMQCNDIYI